MSPTSLSPFVNNAYLFLKTFQHKHYLDQVSTHRLVHAPVAPIRTKIDRKYSDHVLKPKF